MTLIVAACAAAAGTSATASTPPLTFIARARALAWASRR
jgi:hypothetical protein